MTRLENPPLGGRAPLRLAEMTVRRDPTDPSRFPIHLERMEYQPDGVRVRSDAFTDGDSVKYAWLDIAERTRGEGPLVVDLVVSWPFRLPSISLPFGGAPRTFTLETIRGRRRDEPPPRGTIPQPLGFEVTEVDRARLRLAEDVLVVPVHVTVFADADGRVPYLGGEQLARAAISQIFDPGSSTVLDVDLVDSYLESRVIVETALNVPFEDTAPDGFWTACDIQLHLTELEVVPQQDGLERRLMHETNPCGMNPEPLSSYFPVHPRGVDAALRAIPVYIGGSIVDEGLSVLSGATCGPVRVTGCKLTGTPRHDFVLLDARRALEDPSARWTLAHELGHFLGLDHETSLVCGGDLEPDNLMRAGGPASRQLSESFVTDEQCRRARCLAARWLAEWELASPSLGDSECVGLTEW